MGSLVHQWASTGMGKSCGSIPSWREKAHAVIAKMSVASPQHHTRSQQEAVMFAGQETPDSLKGESSPEAIIVAPFPLTWKNAEAPTCLHYGKFRHKLYGQKNYSFCSNCCLYELELGTNLKTFPENHSRVPQDILVMYS